jgi:hypothetical protein
MILCVLGMFSVFTNTIMLIKDVDLRRDRQVSIKELFNESQRGKDPEDRPPWPDA